MYEIILRGNKSFIGKNYLLRQKKKVKLRIFSKNKRTKKNSVILHLVANTSVIDSFKNPAKTINNNLKLLIETLEYCVKNNCKLIFFSTVYQKEKNKFTSPYSYSKFLSEEICKNYSKTYNLDICVLRLSNIFGIFQKNKLIPDLIKKLLKGDTINLINYNLNRDYLYISDLLSATDKIVNSFPNGFSLFTVSQNKNVKIIDVCKKLKAILNSKSKIVKKNNKNHQSSFKRKKIDSSKFRKKFNWKPKFDLDMGLKNLLNYEKK
ncbi:NAD(P)-dependent oxidoreductase [Candidatus Pelagibacter sp.]|nr:NAD(P)-dependent oxidoreductase [Candidatus Pelagibacter sp.]